MKKMIGAAALLSALLCSAAAYAQIPVSDGETLFFDLGDIPNTGYIQVSASDRYTPEIGYGFAHLTPVRNVEANGDGPYSDAVAFDFAQTGTENTFNVDVPNGLYQVTIHAGNITTMSIDMEGYYTIMNMTSSGAMASTEILVEDGQLNIAPVAGKPNTEYSISTIEIKRLGTAEARRTRLFIAGDSITSTYYPLYFDTELDPGHRGGWGQMIGNSLPSNIYVQNYATGGQCAKGFLNDGQFAAVEHFIEAGDYFMIGFGINDQVDSNEDEFYQSMTEMVKRVIAKGAVPIIFTTEGKLTDFDTDGVCYQPGRWYKTTAKKVAQEQRIHYIDLHDLASAYFTAIGYDGAKRLYWINWSGEQDTLHASREGAGQMARLIVEELCRQGLTAFEGNIYDYGVSNDITLKSSGVYDGNLINVQNLSPYPQKIKLLVNCYNERGAVISSNIINWTLPAYDVLDPLKRDTILLDEYCTNCKAYLIKDGLIQDWNGFSVQPDFSVPYDTAQRLFADSIVLE